MGRHGGRKQAGSAAPRLLKQHRAQGRPSSARPAPAGGSQTGRPAAGAGRTFLCSRRAAASTSMGAVRTWPGRSQAAPPGALDARAGARHHEGRTGAARPRYLHRRLPIWETWPHAPPRPERAGIMSEAWGVPTGLPAKAAHSSMPPLALGAHGRAPAGHGGHAGAGGGPGRGRRAAVLLAAPHAARAGAGLAAAVLAAERRVRRAAGLPQRVGRSLENCPARRAGARRSLPRSDAGQCRCCRGPPCSVPAAGRRASGSGGFSARPCRPCCRPCRRMPRPPRPSGATLPPPPPPLPNVASSRAASSAALRAAPMPPARATPENRASSSNWPRTTGRQDAGAASRRAATEP